MANHDWGRACDCRECMTDFVDVPCPSCGTPVTLTFVYDGGWERDNKGMSYPARILPRGLPRLIPCFSCKQEFATDTNFESFSYSTALRKIGRDAAITEGRTCVRCNAVEKFDRRPHSSEAISLTEIASGLVCQGCYAVAVQENVPDPSTEDERYEFDPRVAKWVLRKIRRICVDCGTTRWLGAGNSWRPRCDSCFRKSRGLPRRA